MKQSRAGEIRDHIEQAIVTGAFRPGERLDEVKLAAQFEVSRTPIREALRQLIATELVEAQPHRGTFVKDFSVRDMLNMFEVMSELEGMCARLAARRRSDAQLREIEAACETCAANSESGDADAYYYANEQFHLAIYEASGNAFLARTAQSLLLRLRPFRRLQLRVPGRMRSSTTEHGAIVEAIRAGDSASAEQLIEEHVSVQGDRFGDFVAALGDSVGRP
ncbi:GntR family transcriptional regulator [Pseudoclavibacter endophyticus]|uniref:GntR family transcriptional regulator n=1 Tax=Pseudoclavibacter endophyticus TaxID=1778590 RepID=A0A6H9WJA3_9MICO|nr:GntR family transcriptional regulator [Pseudoclavibacter endophyticus]KAB1648896.1 GntR family transcriptional regulator [Pseudoclavibacter endophyticus]GGA67426.1 GntR family transcriptional regulator [Pseudoclavibacter endophyticus]